MKIHRFYIEPGHAELKHDFWLHQPEIINQWHKVLRLNSDEQVILFNGRDQERLYKIAEINPREAHLQLVTDLVRQLPKREVYLFWSLLKNANNDVVLQKGTELGVSHFIPLIAERSIKTGFNVERAQKICQEAAEQCGRSDLPAVREPMKVATAIIDYQPKVKLLVCQKSDQSASRPEANFNNDDQAVGVLIGPEGGWSHNELDLFKANQLAGLNLHNFTLRAETAAAVAAAQLLQ